MHLVVALYWLLSFISYPQQESSVGGLKFHGSEQPIAKRTSYNVFENKIVTFTDYFYIDFQLSLYPKTPIGYILRIKDEESDRIFNLFYEGQGTNIEFNFNEEGYSNLISAEFDVEDLPNMHWFPVRINFNLNDNTITLSVANKEFIKTGIDLLDTYKPIVLFGKSDHIIDVPSFAIKDLTVGNALKFTFPLKENEGNKVFGLNGKILGKVSNPEWLMNDAYHWKQEASFHSESVAGANYYPSKKNFLYFNNDSLIVHNIISDETTVAIFNQECPVDLVLGTNFLDIKENKLYAYEVYYDYEYEGPTIAGLDLDSLQWSPENYTLLPTQLHHHGSFLNPDTNGYTIFGGFGNMQYSKDFYTYKIDENEWQRLEGFTGDDISPRYFSSVGYSKETNHAYIFGGMGNESGEQIVGRKYYYDLYRVDLDSKRITKLWEIPWKGDNFVPVRGMVIADDSSFYTLCYPEHFSNSFLKLYKFSLIDGSYQILGDSIPIYSDRITTNANLYFDSGLNKLFATVQEFDDDISSDLKIYSLDFPPVTASELNNYLTRIDGAEFKILIVILLFVTMMILILYLFKWRKKSLPDEQSELVSSQHEAENSLPVIKRNSIYFFGDFIVYDRNGKDITYMFSAKLKQALSLIVQYSTEEGITSSHLSEVLWSDKSSAKIKNIRNVTINNLRKGLKELDGVELIYDKGFFKIVNTPEFYCDYFRCIEIISAKDNLEKYRSELLDIIKRGKFLHAANHPLYDSFKEAVEQKLEPVLVVEMERCFNDKSYSKAIDFSVAIFNIDPFNDVALRFQIKALQKLKRKKEAKIKYQAFLMEYKNAMGNDYPHPVDV